jgi:hypothetical protein
MRRNWRNEARTAIGQLRGVSHGSRESEMQAIARHLSGHTDTSALRRAIAAHEFLENLRQTSPDSYAHLSNASLSIVEVIARWFSFDPPAALAAAKDWANGIGNVRSIAKAMQDSRPPGYAGKSGIALGRAYVSDAEPVVIEAVGKLLNRKVIVSQRSVREEAMGQTLDFTFEVTENVQKIRIAVIVVGPYSSEKLYLSRGGDWITKAFGLAWLYDRIVLALPDAKALPDYRRRIDAVNRELQERSGNSTGPRPVVDVVHTDVPKTTPEEDAKISEFFGQSN